MLARLATPLATGMTETQSSEQNQQNWLPWRRPLKNLKINFSLIIYSCSFTNPENFGEYRPGRF